MAKYASDKTYGGQRASVGRVVVVATPYAGRVVLRAGIISSILGDGDTPAIEVIGEDTDGKIVGTFVETRTGADAEAMPAGSWSWPPRL